mmetsp:Transcript_23976/g.35940  ORF Transcript_23976/g.35940 Transcript_23976/m.35940 type:complete len:89 (-) Transcript_23976:176-442(-)
MSFCKDLNRKKHLALIDQNPAKMAPKWMGTVIRIAQIPMNDQFRPSYSAVVEDDASTSTVAFDAADVTLPLIKASSKTGRIYLDPPSG